MNKIKNKNKKGFAMLFTIVIVSAISVITAGLTNAIYKQTVLSSLAKDSQIAFYEADTASDCALYAEFVVNHTKPELFINSGPGLPWSCAGNDLIIKAKKNDPNGNYDITPTPDVINEGGPCFKIEVTKKDGGLNEEGNHVTEVVIKARGYNLCDPSNPRTVEREIEADYNQYD